MLRFFILLSLSVFLSAPLADSQSQNDTSPISSSDKILLKLQKEVDFLITACEAVRASLDAMTLKLEQQTQVLDKVSSKMGIKSDSDSNVADASSAWLVR